MTGRLSDFVLELYPQPGDALFINNLVYISLFFL